MTIKGALAAAAVAVALAGCGGQPDPCEELDQLTAESPELLAADAEDPNGLMAQCIDRIAEQMKDLSPAEREALFGD